MKKNLFTLFFSILLAAVVTIPILADGIIIIDPPPTPPPYNWSPWLTIRYHYVDITIQDQVATTHVDQVFRNDSPVAAEGTYVFPLPPGAVVQQFLMWVDGEKIEGKVLPADEARAIYEDYVRRQQDPALLEYIGRDAVQARIFPIPPGEERRIELEYTQVLPIEDALLHYTYPLDTERFSAQPLEEVRIHVEVQSKAELGALYSSTHHDEIMIERQGAHQAEISYEANNLFPDRNFELYAGFREETISANLITHQQGNQDGFFLLLLSPSLKSNQERIQPRDIFLILDTSGSMEGEKLQQGKAALTYILQHLNPEDRFNIITFSSTVRAYAHTLNPISKADDAAKWVSNLEALGGTNIYLALSEALQQSDPQRTTTMIFLTDGLPTEGIIEEDSLLDALRNEAPNSVRIFPFGVGYDVNTLLLDQLAEDHKGRPSYVEPGERIDESVSAFYHRIQSPILTDVKLEFENTDVYDVYPQPLPDLHAGTQLIITGRYDTQGTQTIKLKGMLDGQSQTFIYEGNFTQGSAKTFIPRLWAARKIGHLLTQIRLHGEQQEWVDAVIKLSLDYGIITPYTSFLVEEEQVLTAEGREAAAEKLFAMPTPLPYGQEAVQDAQARLGLGNAGAAPPAMLIQPESTDIAGETIKQIRYADDKAFLCEESACTDTRFIPDQMDTIDIQFGSETYWQLITNTPGWARYLALSQEVTFVVDDNTAYHIHANDDIPEDNIPEPQTPTPTPIVPSAPTATSSPNSSSRTGLCSGSLILAFLCFAGAIMRLRP